MPFDESTKRKVLQLFPSPICVVGVTDGETIHAFGGSWLGQCSFDPPLVWTAIKNGTRGQTLLDIGGVFAISILSSEQYEIAKGFFKPLDPVEGRFGEVPFHLSEHGAPILDVCQAWIECRVTEKITPGDHTLYFGQVVDCGLNSREPVLTTVTTGLKYGG